MTTQRRRRASPGIRAISDQWLQYIRGTVTLSAANTFTQATVNLPVVVGQGLVIEAHLVEFQAPLPVVSTDLGETDDQAIVQLQLNKSSQAVMLQINDPNYIYGIRMEFVTANARTAEQAPILAYVESGSLNWQFPEPILLPFEQIFFAGNSSGVGAVPTYRFRIGYKTVRLSTRQLPELIQAVT